jgi:hypothetical protein
LCNPCKTCSGAINICTSCPNGLFLQQSSCVATCTTTTAAPYYGNTTLNLCVACNPACTACFGSAYSQCTSCTYGGSQNFYLDRLTSSCVQTCPSGFTADATTPYCVSCTSNCATCSTTPSTCTSCQGIIVYTILLNLK